MSPCRPEAPSGPPEHDRPIWRDKRVDGSLRSWIGLVRMSIAPGQDRQEHLEGVRESQVHIWLEAIERLAKASEQLAQAETEDAAADAKRDIEKYAELALLHEKILQVVNAERDRYFIDRRATIAIVVSCVSLFLRLQPCSQTY